MKELLINPAKTCAVTGHRVLPYNFDKERLKKRLEQIVNIGYDTFMVGMALGFDTECFKALEKIREKTPIKIIACIPCVSQADRFSKIQKAEYERMLDCADEKVYVSIEYDNYCMMKRNKYMVDRSSLVLYYLTRDYGGTKKTVDYAVKKGIMVLKY